MNKKLKIAFGFSSSLILLTACNSVNLEGIAEATEEIDSQLTEFIETDKKMKQEEEDFDSQFQSLLIEDESLDSLQDESAELFKNINKREDEIMQNEEQATTIQEQAEYIASYDGNEIAPELIQQASDHFLEFSEMIRAYDEDYQESIEVQENYFSQIASEEADYDDFLEGLDEVNTNYLSLQESKQNLDNDLIQIYEDISELEELTKEEKNETEIEDQEDTEDHSEDDPENTESQFLTIHENNLLNTPNKFPAKFIYDSGVDIAYPEGGVKGIFSTAHSAGGERMESLVELINTTELNAMVIDVKDDHGNITLDLDSDNELINEMTNEIFDIEELMNTLEENNIYPIARIVVFKDSLLAKSKPEWSFTESNGSVWKNRRGESFVNPYLEEVWDYNIEVAVEAAKLGFKDIQFDYVRFAEGFENRADSLTYTHGNYVDDSEDVINMEYRNRAVTEFVRKSKESLMPYGADLSVDIFGYAAVVRETPGIGQSFPGIAKEVDVISSMIYPSHWGAGNLDVSKPDLEPYKVVDNYIKIEQEIFDELGEEAPITRPWLQDFTASYLGAGNYKNYGAAEVTAQVEALADNGVYEFLLWNAGNRYSEGARYKFD